MQAALILNGPALEPVWLKQQLSKVTYLVAADGGARSLQQLELVPNYWVGDGDSSTPTLRHWLRSHQVFCQEHAPCKAHTDGYLAWQLMVEQRLSFNECYILQALGGRLDHQIANLGLVKIMNDYLLAGDSSTLQIDHAGLATIITPSEQVTVLPPMRMQLSGKPQNHFSLQAYGGTVAHLNVRHAAYSLKDYQLAPEEDLTISNQFSAVVGSEISWTSGYLMLWVEGECQWQRLS